jgi:cytochrome c556
MLKKTLLAGLAVTIIAGAAWALDDKQAIRATETRQAVLKVIGWNIGPMSGMVREQIPYDAAVFQRNADRIAYMGTMLVDAFRPDTTEFPVETEALDNIWSEFGEFERLANAMNEKAVALNETAKGGDFDAVKAAFVELGQSCKDCHDKFREDKD